MSAREALLALLAELAGSREVINRPDMRALARETARRCKRAISDHDVSKLLWSLQKEGRIKLFTTHSTGHSRTGTVVKIEVIR